MNTDIKVGDTVKLTQTGKNGVVQATDSEAASVITEDGVSVRVPVVDLSKVK